MGRKKKADLAQEDSGPQTRYWSTAEEEELVEQLLEEQAKGNQAGNGWKPVVWKACSDCLAEKFPKEPEVRKEKTHVKSCWHQLKKQWKIVAALRAQSGFGWNEATQMVTAKDSVWRDYLAAHPEARPFREHPFPLFDKLAPLIEPVVATGDNALHLGPAAEAMTTQSAHVVDDEDEDDDEDDSDVPATTRKRRAATPTAPLPKRVCASGAQGFLAMAEAVKDLSEAMASANSGTSQSSPERHRQAVQLLEQETDFSEDELVTAIDLFTRNRGIGDSYAAITKRSLRTRWLRKKLYEESAPISVNSGFGEMSSSPVPGNVMYSQYNAFAPMPSSL